MRKILVFVLTIMLAFSSALPFNTVSADENENESEESSDVIILEEESEGEDTPEVSVSEEESEGEDTPEVTVTEEENEDEDSSDFVVDEEESEEDDSSEKTEPVIENNDEIEIENAGSDVYKSGTCGDDVTYTIYSNGSVIISGSGPMTDYLYDSVFSDESDYIKKVQIQNGVTSIGDDAFNGCSSLSSISIPNSVTSIGDAAFFNCTSLKSITIPSSVTSIGISTFCYCPFTSVVLPNSVTSIGEYAFSGCDSLTSITLSNSLASIGDYAFADCFSLSSITVPNSVTSIGDGTFASCSSLTSATLSNSLTSIGEDTFYNCSLTSIIIPDSVTSIDKSAFHSCSILSSIELPSSLTSIGDYAFYDCSSLSSIEFSSSLTSIGEYAFSGCDSLTSITLSNSLTSIGEGAFSYCTSLTSITIPASVISIGAGAFYFCDNVRLVYIPSAVETIAASCYDDSPFFACYYNLTIYTDAPSKPSDWGMYWNYIYEDVQANVVYNCSYTQYTGILAQKEYWKTLDKNSENIVIPDYITFIPANAFSDCYKLKTVTIPSSVTSIGLWAFFGCTSLTAINIPSSVTVIENNAFASCSSLESISVDRNNTVYDSRNNCNAIIETATNTLITGCKNTIIPSSVTTIYNYAFCGSDLTSINIPSSVTLINNYAFQDCFNLMFITVDENNTVYDSRDNCNAIIVTSTNTLIKGCGGTMIPSSVTSISQEAFSNCFYLNSIAIPSSVTSIGIEAFSSCYDLTSAYIPSSVTTIGKRIFYYCGRFDDFVVYTDASEDPEGWDEDWNNLDYEGTEKATVIYNTSFEQYKEITGKKFTVKFNANGGSGKMSDARISQYGQLPLNTITRKGYTFAGWNTNAKGTGTALQDGQVLGILSSGTGVTLYAQWTLAEYSLSLNPNGGTPASKQSYDARLTLNEGIYTGTYTVKDAAYKLPTLVKNGYSFAGWYNTDTDKKVTSIEKGSTGNLYLEARFSPVAYKITYSTNSGKLVANKSDSNYSSAYSIETASLNLPDEHDILRTGYTFDGWYGSYNSKTKTYSSPITSLEELKDYNSNVYKAVTLYAKWTPITYYIQYASDDYTSDVIEMTYDASYKLLDTILDNPGKKAQKYTYTVNGKSVTVAATSAIKNLVKVNTSETDPIVFRVSKDKKGNELWSNATYTITYNLNGGTNSSKNKKSYTITTSTFNLLPPSRKGASFMGWYDNAEYNGQPITSVETGTYGNKTFYAKWQLVDYTISFNVNEGQLPDAYESGSISYTVEDAITLQSPTRENHTFAGWYKGKTKVTSIKKGTTGNMNLTAKWTEGTNYTVVYDKNDPTATGKMSTTKVSAGKNVALTNNAYKLTGKVFVEWNTMADGTGLSFKNKDTLLKSAPLSMYGNETITLYAIWDDVYSFSIHFDANTGNGTMKSLSMSNKAYKALTANTFKKPGYSFVCWNSEPDGSGMSYKNKEVFWKYNGAGADVTLYAIWTPIVYKITYKNMKSTDINPNPTTYTVLDDDIILSNPQRNGYCFAGWYTDSKYKNRIESIDTESLKSYTLYPRWIKE